MNTTHTPGPWHLKEPDSPYVYAKSEEPFAEKYTRLIADCRTCFRDSEAIKANARLIAAAPELLEALKGMVALIPEQSSIQYFVQMKAARQAIAKAEGGEA